MKKEEIIEAIKKAKEGKKRKFKQSIDLCVNLENIELKKAENKIKADIVLPKGTGKKIKIGIFADSLIPQVKKLGDDVILIRKDEIEAIGKNKKKCKQLATECYAFISEAPLMPAVGRFMGQVLAVRGKMPTPFPPAIPNLRPLVDRIKSTLKIALKDNPVIHCIVGNEDMSEEDVYDNINIILKNVESALPKGKEQIRNICIKMTMGKPVKLQVK